MKHPILNFVGTGCLTATLMLLVACGGGSQTQQKKEKTYLPPTVPSMISEPDQRAAYAVEHYWDKFDFTDREWIADSGALEQTFANYIGIMSYAPENSVRTSFAKTFATAAKDSAMYRRLAQVAEHYLYEPNSPMKNEAWYVAVLDALLSDSVLTDAEKVRLQFQRQMTQRNQVGEKAADIPFVTSDGVEGSLYGLKSPYVLLFFHDPDCGTCRDLTLMIDRSGVIQQLIASKQLTVLTIYPDEEEQAWRNHLTQMPQQGWIHGWDQQRVLRREHRYDLRALPTLYLLDKGKKVLIKDGTFNIIEQACSKLEVD